MARMTGEIANIEVLKRLKLDTTMTARFVQTSVGRLVAITRTNAPKKSGDLRAGIIPSPWEEKTAVPGKVVREVYFDEGMNDTFVKYSKAGKRYYYPASMEYGYLINRAPSGLENSFLTKKVGDHLEWRRGVLISHGYAKRIPGHYFMRDSAVEYAPEFVAGAENLIEEVGNRD